MPMITYKSAAAGAKAAIKTVAANKYRSLVERTWGFDAAEWRHCQEERFRAIYSRARTTVPYYRERPVDYPELNPDCNISEFLSALPLLPKSIVREYNKEFWPAKSGLLRTQHRTSGSTGTPLVVSASLAERALSEAILQSWFRRICGSTWPRTLSLSGFLSPPPGSQDLAWYDPVTRRVFLNIYSLSRARRAEVLGVLRRFRPKLIFGYSSAIGELARLVNGDLEELKQNAVVVATAETMQERDRADMLGRLASKVFNLYGSQEGTHMALECEQRSWHIVPLTGIVEILDDNGYLVPAGSSGQVVVTSLSKPSMPLFRYLIRDVGVSTGYANCRCGLGWPTMGQVEGRCEDQVRTPDGRRIGLLTDALMKQKNRELAKEAQIIQRSYEDFEVRLVLASREKTLIERLERDLTLEMTKRLGYPVTPKFVYLDEIPRGARGKFKAVIVDFSTD